MHPCRSCRWSFVGMMSNNRPTAEAEPTGELAELRRRIAELEASAARRNRVEEELRESEAKYSTLVEQSVDAVLITQDGVFQFVNKAAEKIYGYTVEEMTGMPFFGTLAPECRDLVVQRYEARVAGKEVEPSYEARILYKDGTPKDVEISGRLMQYKGRPAVTAIVRDITHRKNVEQKILQRSRELAALHSVLMSITRTLDLEKVLREIVSQVGAAVDSAYTSIATVNENGDLGIGCEDFAHVPPSRDGPHAPEVIDKVVTTGEAVVVDDVDAEGDLNPLHLAMGIKSYAVVPMRTKQTVTGVLLVHSLEPGAFGGRTELLAAFANQAAIAIENARLYDTVSAERSRVEQLLGQVLTAQEDERRRLSLDLHDTVTQSMYGVLAHVGAAEELLYRSNFEKLKGELTHAKKALEQTLADLRRVAAGLHPPILGKRGLAQALRQHVGEYAENNKHICSSFRLEGGARRLDPSVEIGVYRIAQEALSNTRRHADATKVDVLLRFLPAGISLEVTDNGKGFDFSARIASGPTDGHLGLAGMMERAELMGGTLKVETHPGGGTKIEMSIPVMAPGGKQGYDMASDGLRSVEEG
jgi:PAS domain S-box-containing protein